MDSKIIIDDINRMFNSKEKAILRYLYTFPFLNRKLLCQPEVHNIFRTLLANIANSEKKLDPFHEVDYMMYHGPSLYISMNENFLLGLTKDVVKLTDHSHLLTDKFLKDNPEIYDEDYHRMIYQNGTPREIKNLYYKSPRTWHIAFSNSPNRSEKLHIGEYIDEKYILLFYTYYWQIYYMFFLKRCIADKLQDVLYIDEKEKYILKVEDVIPIVNDLSLTYNKENDESQPNCHLNGPVITCPEDEEIVILMNKMKNNFIETLDILSLFDMRMLCVKGVPDADGKLIVVPDFYTYYPVLTRMQIVIAYGIHHRKTIYKMGLFTVLLYTGYRYWSSK